MTLEMMEYGLEKINVKANIVANELILNKELYKLGMLSEAEYKNRLNTLNKTNDSLIKELRGL